MTTTMEDRVAVVETPPPPVEMVEQILEVQPLTAVAPYEKVVAAFPPCSDPAQLRHRSVIASRPTHITLQGSYLAAHTILRKKSDDFEGHALQDLANTLDAVLTRQWTTNKKGLPHLSSCYRLYSPRFDHRNNTVVYGAICRLAKDGSQPPMPDATGVVFDYLRDPINFWTFIDMDGEIEAASKNIMAGYEDQAPRHEKLTRPGPLFADVLLGYPVGSLPLYDKFFEATSDRSIQEALQAEIIRILSVSDLHIPAWIYAPEGVITEISHEEEDKLTCLVFDDERVVEVPNFATLCPYVALGANLEGMPVANLKLPGNQTWSWDALCCRLSPRQLSWLKKKVWIESRFVFENLEFVPNKFVDWRAASQCRRVLRDLRLHVDERGADARRGRTYHDRRFPHKTECRPTEAPISVWNMGGPATKERLQFEGPGYTADFYTILPAWQKLFEP